MEITPRTAPGLGRLHECRTRDGQRFTVLVEHSGRRSLLVHQADDVGELDEPMQQIVLDPDEADELAGLLHSRPLPDRVSALERRLAMLTGEA